MNFHINHTPPKALQAISHKQKIMLTGSCFAENIGTYLQAYKFDCIINSSGILFNPISILHSLNTIVDNSELQPELLVQNDESFYSLLHHGDFRSESRDGLLTLIHGITEKSHEFMKQCDWLIITFGSAFVYRHLASGEIAANCHKLPQQFFRKELLKTEDIISAYNKFIKKLQSFRPGINLLFSVSPVKYLRDGLVENNLSKAILIQSVHEIISQNSNCFYFPAYELITDDLRDYRFYKEDLAHPNETAVKYVWEKFSATYFSEETKILNERIKDILQASHHRPINEHSSSHLKFKETYLRKCEALEKEFSFLDLTREKEYFTV